MTARKDIRFDQADLHPHEPDPAVGTALVRAADRPVAAPPPKSDDEKMHIFWRVFGGAILSIVALTGITLFNHVQNNILELRGAITKLSEERGDLIRKDEFNSRTNNNYQLIQGTQSQVASLNTTLVSLKTELDGQKEKISKSATDQDQFRKEIAGSLDALKKELNAIESQKERITAILDDLKQFRDDTTKLKHELERNQIADQERRLQRDEQVRAIEKSIKDLQTALQEIQVKLARIEGQTQAKPAEQPKSKNHPEP